MTNGVGADTEVPADTYNLQITAAGDPATVAFDADVNLAEGTDTIAYAIGSVGGGTFQVVTNTISGLQSAPEGVPTGNAGTAATSNLLPVALLAFGLVGIAGGVKLLVRREN